MSSPAINTVIEMMESLPEDRQNELVEHLREYLQDLQEEAKWQDTFDKSQDKLVSAARLAKQQIANSKARPRIYIKGTALVVESQPISNLETSVEQIREDRISDLIRDYESPI